MKKVLLSVSLFISMISFSQVIAVDSSIYTVSQLVNSVLINNPCVSATNISSSTGINFGSSNGIGYFTNSHPNFPIQSGVILSTGNANNAVGPNTSLLNDGVSAWTGDSDLENTLAQSGINMTSTNATSLEFDFTPISPQFGFDFVFASEEYGNYQCQFSDAFAFLVTNLNTGVTTNLAVVPNSTTPISVITIRDYLYNSGCLSANSQYFGQYNGGLNAATSPTNFNGQTILMNAHAVLVPNTPYHVKLVIADRNDPLSDSAIFLSANSFNIGQNVLGPDLTVQNNSAVCFGSNYTLNSNLSASEYSFVWKKDGVLLPSEINPTLVVTQAGQYSLTYNKISDPCNPITDTIKVEYFPKLNTPNPINLYRCQTGSSVYNFDLEVNTPIIKNNVPNFSVSYFSSLSNLNNNINSLTSPYQSIGNEKIYALITNTITGCTTVKTFFLNTTPSPAASQPADMISCESTVGSNSASFNLSNNNSAILNSQNPSIYIVSYYLSLNDANSRINPLASNYVATNATQIFARVETTTDNSCFSTTSFYLNVNPKPQVDNLPSVITCTNYTLPTLVNGNYFTSSNGGGTPLFAGNVINSTKLIYIFNSNSNCSSQNSFNVVVVDLEAIKPQDGTYCDSYTLPSLPYGKYYSQPNGQGTQLNYGSKIFTSKTIYIYYASPIAPFCIEESQFVVTIKNTPVIPVLSNVNECLNYVLPSLSVGNYFSDATHASASLITPGTSLTSTQDVYVYAETGGTPNCSSQKSFNVKIGFNASSTINTCQNYTLPVLANGDYYELPNAGGQHYNAGAIITSTKTLYVYYVSSTGCVIDNPLTIIINSPLPNFPNITVCGSYVLPALQSGNYFSGDNGTGTAFQPGDVITSSKKIFVYLNSGSCIGKKNFQVTIVPIPQIDSRASIDVCDSYQLTNLSVGKYYTGNNGSGQQLQANSLITNSQTIFIYAVNTLGSTSCSAENNFTITVFSVKADKPLPVIKCESYQLPALQLGNYYTAQNGPHGTGTIMNAGDVITDNTTLYVYRESGERKNCTAEHSFTITIAKAPVFTVTPVVNTCNSYTLPALTIGNYFTNSLANGHGTMLNANTNLTSNQTIYVYAEGSIPNCATEKSITINLFKVPVIQDQYSSCTAFVLPTLSIGQYYTGQNASGNILLPGTTINTTQRIYIYANSPVSNCHEESSFLVTVMSYPAVNPVPVSNRTVCDYDDTNDGSTLFDLTTLNSFVLGSQLPTNFAVTYHNSMNEANAGINAITSTLANTFFVRVTNRFVTDCFATSSIQIIVNKIPETKPKDGFICVDEKGILVSSYTIYSQLSTPQYSFVWKNLQGTTVGYGANYSATITGVYSVIAKDINTGCYSDIKTVEVKSSEPAQISCNVSDAFVEFQTITVSVTGSGEYEFQIDGENFQSSPVFSDVSFGTHHITVHDINGCGSSHKTITVENYPKFFTPNQDGENDYWQVFGFKKNIAQVFIFDRFGKLIKEFKTSEQGWDGTIDGNHLPADDYWFSIVYQERGVAKEFKSHFALVR